MSTLTVFIIGHFDGSAEVADALKGYADLREVSTPAEALALVGPDVRVPFFILNSDHLDTSSSLADLYARPQFSDALNVVLTSRDEHHDLAPAIDAGYLHSLVRTPAKHGTVPEFATSQVHTWMVEHGLDPVPIRRSGRQAHGESRADLLYDLGESDDELSEQLVSALDSAFSKPRPRIFLPPGVRLTRQGEEVRGVFILIEGKVALTRSTPSEDLLLHHASTGRIIGILSLAGEKQAFFNSTTTTESTLILLSLDQLTTALRRDPEISAGLAVSAIRGLSQRLLRSEELQVERNELNLRLEREQKRLAKALRQLEEARLELVSQAKFATLGELSAGIAHELNNPVAALTAAAGHIAEDIDPILASHPQGPLLRTVTDAIRTRTPLSTSEERKIRREIEARTKDPELAFRLVAAGVTDPHLASKLNPADLHVVELAASLATASRNITTASSRIAELVRSLRSYARPEAELAEEVDVNVTIDETLALVSHRLRGIDVERHYGTLPPIEGHPSQLGQMWTNLLVNAAEVLQGTGTIAISTEVADTAHVRVSIADDGPGIPPENLKRVFEPRFTTKQGTIRYGMGLGLGLTRSLVEGHGGTIAVESERGRTVFTVLLPISSSLKEEK
ncbi:MAG: ATP-binding protein [Ruaniaceae bacterium]|nr:ATP-binding protein [Ruaniaceae bacterium]